MGLVVPNTVNFFNGKMIVTDATLGTNPGRVLSFDVPQSAHLGTLTVMQPRNTCHVLHASLHPAHHACQVHTDLATKATWQVRGSCKAESAVPGPLLITIMACNMQHALVPCLLPTSGVPAHDLSTSSATCPAGSGLALQSLDGRFVKHGVCACWLP